jgi:hypothetical protein
MPTINKLTRTDTVSAGDVVPVYVQNQGDARGASMTVISDFVQSQIDVSALAFNRGAPVNKVASFTVADTENWIICNGAGIVVTLPLAGAYTGREIMIKTIAAQAVISASANVVPLTTSSPGTAILAGTAGNWATLVSDGANWVIMQARP